MTINNSALAKYISLLAMTVFTVIEVVSKQTSVFYILYLFWFDECIRTFFDGIQSRFAKNQIENPTKFNYKEKLFLLFGYFVFIVIIFGFVIDRKDFDLIRINLTVLTFQNTLFNYSLVTFVLREIYLFRKVNTNVEFESQVTIGIITLHISIVLGILFWFLSAQKLQFMTDYANVIAIIPFLLLKLFFEIKTAK